MFVRTILAMSLGCLFAGTAFATATTAEQPLKPKVVTNTAVEDPINPLAVGAASSAQDAQITPQEQQDLNKASQTLRRFGSMFRSLSWDSFICQT